MFNNQSDFEIYMQEILDDDRWEICGPPMSKESLEFIEKESGLTGLPGDEPGDIIPFSIDQVEPLTEEVWYSMSDYEKQAEEDLRALVGVKLPEATLTPVELSQGIEFAGSLIRDCFRIEAISETKRFWVYVRQVDDCDSFLERCSGPMWEGS